MIRKNGVIHMQLEGVWGEYRDFDDNVDTYFTMSKHIGPATIKGISNDKKNDKDHD